MDNDCGAPAFENIDEILSEKIITHSIRHTREEPQVSNATIRQSSGSSQTPPSRRSRSVVLLLGVMILLLLCASIAARIFHTSSE